MSYTVKELDEAIEKNSWYDFHDSLWYWGEDNVRSVDIPGIGQATLLEDHGGGEGSGEERWFVFKVVDKDGERIFRRNGAYYSFVGSEFDGPTDEVKAEQKLFTVWTKV